MKGQREGRGPMVFSISGEASKTAPKAAAPNRTTSSRPPTVALASCELDAVQERGGIYAAGGSVADKIRHFKAGGRHREGSGFGEFTADSRRRRISAAADSVRGVNKVCEPGTPLYRL